MFTRKQRLRRQINSERHLRPNLERHPEIARALSLPDHLSSDATKTPADDEPKEKKHIHFGDSTRVVLVPCRAEYEQHGVADDIWWTAEDYVYFKMSARLEMLECIDEYNGNIHNALTALYQPNYDEVEDPFSMALSPRGATADQCDSETASTNEQVDVEVDIASLPACDCNAENNEGQVFFRTGKAMKPLNMLSCDPRKRASRDSLHNINPTNKPPKHVHPLALITV